MQCPRLRALILPLVLAFAPAARAQIAIEATHPNGEVSLVVDFEVKPGAAGEFEAHFRRSVTCSRLEPDNITFNVHKVAGSENRYILYEIWRSVAALEAHLERPYTRALFAMFEQALERPVDQGGLRFVADLDPAPRPDAPEATSTPAECR